VPPITTPAHHEPGVALPPPALDADEVQALRTVNTQWT
jgi:hypothetical protein